MLSFYWEVLNQMGYASKKYYRGDAKRQLHKEIWQLVGEKGKNPVHIVDGKINNVCTAGLLYAMSQKKRVIDDHMISHVIEVKLTW